MIVSFWVASVNYLDLDGFSLKTKYICKQKGSKLINKGSYMSAHVLLNVLNELGKIYKMRGLSSILSLFATSLINSIIYGHEY